MAEFRFLYQPVVDLGAAVDFYVDVLGFEETWRDGDVSVGMRMPGGVGQVMLSISGKPAGAMYLVESLDAWIQEHPDATLAVERDAAGAGSVAGFRDPGGNIFYIFDQPTAP